jgi:acyl-CoA thioesterase
MTQRPAHFTPVADGFQPTGYARSHWGEDHLNGRAIVGLAARAMEKHYGTDDFMPARLTVDLFRAARGVLTTVQVRLVRDGRRVRNVECDVVQRGVPVAHAVLLSYCRSAPPPGELWHAVTKFEMPDDLDARADELPYTGSDDVGWSRTVGEHQNSSRTRFLDRTIDVVAGEPNTPFVRAAMIAESTSLTTNLGTRGVGYINGDLTVGLARLPVDGWLGVQADSHFAADGIAVGSATLFDAVGPFGTGLVSALANPAAQIEFTDTDWQGVRI